MIGRENAALITDAVTKKNTANALDEGVQLLVTRDYWVLRWQQPEAIKIENLGFEDTLPFRDFDYLDENFVGADIAPVPALLEAIREVKDTDELAKLRRSAEVAARLSTR